jgi:polar amino acid transport system substrate-binding protein
MRKLSLLLLCALAFSACVSPPEDIDRVPNFDPTETLMGQIQERKELRIGIPEDAGAPFVVSDETTFELEGFIPALSQEVADALGVDVEYLFLDEDDQILPGRPEVTAPVDISFVSVPATEELAKGHPLTHPYWVAHQRVLAPVDSGIEEWPDIEGPYCSIVDETTGFDLSDAGPGLDAVEGDASGCAQMLKKGDVDAVTAPDIDLMRVWAALGECQQPCEPSSDYAIVGDELTTEGYSALLPVGSPGWTNFVNATWGEAEAEGRWFDYYEEWIAPFGIVLEEAPDMRIEEAAGLFPCDSAC